MASFISVPFQTQSEHGITKYEGIGKFSAAGIILEFEAKLLGLVSNGIMETRLSLDDILDLKLTKGFFGFGRKIEIRLRNMAQLNELPITKGRIKLKIERRDAELAAEAVDRIMRAINGPVLGESESEALPPAPASFLPDTSEAETKEL